MAKFNYNSAQTTALRLLKQFGGVLPVLRFRRTFDPVTGVDVLHSITLLESTCVNLPATNGTIQAFDNKTIEELKKGKNRFFYMAARDLSIEPESDDYLIYQSGFWRIVGNTPLNPNGTPLVYNIGCADGGITYGEIESTSNLTHINFLGTNLTKTGNEVAFAALEIELFAKINSYVG